MSIITHKEFILNQLTEPIKKLVSPFFDLSDLNFYVVGERNSKLGDFKVNNFGKCEITINQTLTNRWFVLTLLHELSHYQVYKQFGRRVKPHGNQWKAQLSFWVNQMLKGMHFEEEFKLALQDYSYNPRASVNAHKPLYRFFLEDHPSQKRTPINNEFTKALANLEVGAYFSFKGKSYKLIEHKNKRALIENENRVRYLLSSQAQVTPRKMVAAQKNAELLLEQLVPGDSFWFNHEPYTFINLRRTKVLIRHNKKAEEYLLSKGAKVTLLK
jgi:SprT protein